MFLFRVTRCIFPVHALLSSLFHCARVQGRGLNFLAFGGGGHKCLGLRLAELELFVGVVELLSRFRATIVGGTPDEALDPLRMRVATLGLPLPPKHLASVRLEPRA